MLVLTRKEGERLVLMGNDGEVVIEIHEIAAGRVRVAIDAPQSVRIIRQELLKRSDGEGSASDAVN